MPKVPAERALVHVPFNDDTIEAIPESGRVLVPLRSLCERLGLDVDAQRQRLRRHAWTCTVVTTVQVGDQTRELFCLDLDSLPMWLATISTRRVRPEVRPKLERYQREAARVLRDYFLGPRPELAPAAAPDAPDVRALALVASRGDVAALMEALPTPAGDPAAAALVLLEQAGRLLAAGAKLRGAQSPPGPAPKAIGAGGTSSDDPALISRAFKELIEGRPELREAADRAFKLGGRRGLQDEGIDLVRRAVSLHLLEGTLRGAEPGWCRVPGREQMRSALHHWRMYRAGPLRP